MTTLAVVEHFDVINKMLRIPLNPDTQSTGKRTPSPVISDTSVGA